MNREEWARVRALLEELVELEPGALDAWLASRRPDELPLAEELARWTQARAMPEPPGGSRATSRALLRWLDGVDGVGRVGGFDRVDGADD